MQKFRVTTVSRRDGTATTKQFKTYAAARDVWDVVTNDNNRSFYIYGGLYVVNRTAQTCQGLIDGRVTRFAPDFIHANKDLSK